MDLKVTLSPREHEVLVMAIQGHTIRQVASVLHISRSAVKRYRERILGKLHAPCMETAILRVHHLGIVDLDSIPDVFVGSKAN